MKKLTLFDRKVQNHLHGFIDNFISETHRHRWKHFIFEKPDKAQNEMGKFIRHHNEKCTFFEHSRIEENLDSSKYGYYYDGDLCLYVCFNEINEYAEYIDGKQYAGTRFGDLYFDPWCDAIFSVVPGKLAYFLHHEWWFWECKN
jgi:hypothetical protein